METATRILQTIVGSLICYALSGPVISVSHALNTGAPTPARTDAVAFTPLVLAQAGTLQNDTVTDPAVTDPAVTDPAVTDPKMGDSEQVEDEPAICEAASIKQAFKPPAYEATKEDIKGIQQQLKIKGFNPVLIDGDLGTETYRAFANFCNDIKIEEDFKARIEALPEDEQAEARETYKKALAEKLVKRLFDSDEDEPSKDDSGQVDTDSEDEVKICEVKSIENAFEPPAFEATKEYKERIQLQLMISGFDPGMIDGDLGPETFKAFAKLCNDIKIEEDFKATIEEQPDDKQAEAEETYKSTLAEKLVTRLFHPPINMTGAGCGCSGDFSRTVYGVYPYLRTGGDPMEVNFDLLDRIGFYGLVLDQSGEIRDDLGWNITDENVANFIYEAHRHRVKADVSFVALDWVNWGFGEMSKAATNVAKIANREYRSKNDPLSWIALAPSHSVDGVNLVFEMKGTETSIKGKSSLENISDASKKLHKIVSHVSEKLKEIGSEAKINIALGLDLSVIKDPSLVKEDGPYHKLREILKHDNPAIDKILVTIKKMDDAAAADNKNQSTDESKKELTDAEIEEQQEQMEQARRRVNQILMLLRWQIEKAYAKPQGLPDFDTVIRKILPIVMTDEASHKPLDGKDSQFKVDLAYLEDNFGGVALTPLPLKSAANAKDISEALIAKFAKFGTGGSDSDLCQLVCPNRVFVYAFLGLLFFLMVAFRLAAMVNCQVSSVYQQRIYMNLLNVAKVIFLVGLVVTFNCDPDPPVDIFTVVGIFALLLWAPQIYGYFARQNRPVLP